MISILLTTEGQTNISNIACSPQIIWMVFFFLDGCENQRLWWPPSGLFTLSPALLWSLLHSLSGQLHPLQWGHCYLLPAPHPAPSAATPFSLAFCSYCLSPGETSLLQGLPFQGSTSSRQWAQREPWKSLQIQMTSPSPTPRPPSPCFVF